jgi:hypothetical protein
MIMNKKISLTCLNPRAEVIAPDKILGLTTPRVVDLRRKRIGLVWCEKRGGENYFDAIQELMEKRIPTAKILRMNWAAGIEKKLREEVDTFIYGVGDSGIGAWESTARTIAIEKLGKPGVVVFSSHLIPNAKASAISQGMPAVRMVTLPSLEYYPNRVSEERLRPVAEKTIDAIVDALTRPLTLEEINPEVNLQEKIPGLVSITEDNYECAYEKFNQIYIDNHWGDGLPLVPPTQEAVKLMLTGTKRSPDEIIGTFTSPDGLADIGVATVEKIAINAVMAGAKPEYLPVIITAVESLTDKKFSPHVFTSEGSFTLLIIVSGPIAKKINMNSGIGLLGHGWRSNNTIGRAVRLCMINIGNLWPGEHDLALIGRPSSHTFYVMAESEEMNPWQPSHVNLGFKPEESCVTVATVMGYGAGGLRIYGGGTVLPWSEEEILHEIVQDVAKDRRIFQYNPRSGNRAHPQAHVMVLHPEFVNELNQKGFNSRSLLDYIIEKTSVRYEELSKEEIQGIKDRIADKSDVFFGSDLIPPDRIPVFEKSLKQGGSVPVVLTPQDIHIVVAGGISGYSFGFAYARGALQTKLIR